MEFAESQAHSGPTTRDPTHPPWKLGSSLVILLPTFYRILRCLAQSCYILRNPTHPQPELSPRLTTYHGILRVHMSNLNVGDLTFEAYARHHHDLASTQPSQNPILHDNRTALVIRRSGEATTSCSIKTALHPQSLPLDILHLCYHSFPRSPPKPCFHHVHQIHARSWPRSHDDFCHCKPYSREPPLRAWSN